MEQASPAALAKRLRERRGARSSWVSRLTALSRDPLFHFMILGGLLFAAGLAWRHAHDPNRIVVDRFTLDRIAVGYRQRFGEPPSPQALRLAVAEYVGDEVLYREGVAQGVEKDDEIIRRRIIQKMRFLQEDRTLAPTPSEAALRRYYGEHRAQYITAPQASFSHVYFSTDGGEAAARRRAEQVRAALVRGESSATAGGDPFPDRSSFSNLNETDAERVFGKSDFSRALFTLEPGIWSRPVASGFGVHLIHVDHRSAASVAPFEAVRARIAADYAQDTQNSRNDQAIRNLEARYTISLPDGMTLK